LLSNKYNISFICKMQQLQKQNRWMNLSCVTCLPLFRI
jgi:hypothetical protein